jgi:hypothetical protein
MTDPAQLDLFGNRPELRASPSAPSLRSLVPENMSDVALIAALPDSVLADACALAAEAGKRRLGTAMTALAALCDRFVGHGTDRGVPEQAAALEALAAIGGPEASRSVSRMIVKGVIQGPTLAVAATVASQLGVVFPTDIALRLLRHSSPLVRAPACFCVRAGHEVGAALIGLLGDLDRDVSTAAACALGRMGRVEARIYLKRHLAETPSPGVIEALAGVADDDAIVLLARVGRVRPDLSVPILSALDEIDNVKAAAAASGLRGFLSTAEIR